MKNVYIASGIAAAVILIGSVAFAQSAAFTSQMGVGTQGSNVTSLQTWLTNAGYYSGPITGYFGPLTMAGVENFQTAHSISATGYVGPLTLAALNANESVTSTTGNQTEIAQLQAELNSLLAEIQALESGTVTTGTSIPSGNSMTVQTNENASVNGTVTTAAGTSPFTYALSRSPSNGVITSFNSTTGAFTYMPNSNFSGSDSFAYTISNSAGTSAPVTVTVNVGNSTNSGAPIGQALSFSTNGNVAYNGTLSASSNSPVTYAIGVGPVHGSISNFNSSTGAFTYTPTANYTGSDSFTYTVSNSVGVSSPVTVTITDGSSSAAPTGQPLSVQTTSGVTVSNTLSASGTGPFTFHIVNNPTWGTLNSFNSLTGAFSYTPNSGYKGPDSFTYDVSNSNGTSPTYTVTITNS